MIHDILIKIFNKLLELNSGSKNEIAKYCGKSFILNIIGVQLKATIKENGQLEPCIDISDAELDTIIIIPMSITTFLINQDKIELFRQIEITGDKSFGINFLEILSKLNFAGVYAKVSPLNAVFLQHLEKILILIKDYLIQLSNNMSLSLSEYMLYETGNIVNKHKIERFCSDVDALKEKTNLLEKKMQKLMGDNL